MSIDTTTGQRFAQAFVDTTQAIDAFVEALGFPRVGTKVRRPDWPVTKWLAVSAVDELGVRGALYVNGAQWSYSDRVFFAHTPNGVELGWVVVE